MMSELEFKSLVQQGYNRIPLLMEAFADLETPLSLYLKLAYSQDGGRHSFLLESVVGGERFGRIVNITSSAVKAPIDILGLSNGARSGLTGFVAGVARTTKLASRNVTINNLLPGAYDTDRLKGTMKGAADKSGQPIEAIMDTRKKTIPALRFGQPDEFGDTCAFLCSQQAGYITGQNVLTDGGAYPGTY